ncbi:hypothetical protein ACFL7M_16810 [Thermodesulfobacteriota bacterium]
MPTKSQKEESLKHAIVIAKEFARGGSSQAVANVLQSVYETINKIKDEIEGLGTKPKGQQPEG